MAEGRLLFVAGGSPQILTETAYALLRPALPPTKIEVLTTTRGREAIERSLFGKRRIWTHFRREYRGASAFRFSPKNVVVLEDPRGKPLEDVRTDADSRAVMEQVARFVERRTRPGEPPLHASLAGGRKTMGYALAVAMMLYGREQDRLSHVLVSPEELEGTDFFFPPARPSPAKLEFRRPDGRVVRVNREEIRIDLVDLPFPRLGALRDLREARFGSVAELVEALQNDLEQLASPRIVVSTRDSLLRCGNRDVRLSPVRAELYALLAERRRDGCGREECEGCEKCFVPAEEIEKEFRRELRRRLEERGSYGVGEARRQWRIPNFRAERAKINKAIGSALRWAADPYRIVTAGSRGRKLYGLRLSPRGITVRR